MHLTEIKKGDHRWWKYVLAFIALVIAIVMGEIPLSTFCKIQKNKLNIDDGLFEQYLGEHNYSALGISENMVFFLLMAAFLFLFVTLVWIIPKIHRKSALSFITTRTSFDKTRFLTGLLIWFGFACLFALIVFDTEQIHYNFRFSKFMPLLILAIVLIPIQTAVEEILFRGYLLQSLFLLTKNKWIALWIVTILFALAHMGNPEMDVNFLLVIAGYFTLSLLFGIITLIDNGLEIPIGIHAGNNLFVALILSATDGAFNTPSIFKTNSEFLTGILPISLILLSILTFTTLKIIYKWKIK